jgi:hypothetical protein
MNTHLPEGFFIDEKTEIMQEVNVPYLQLIGSLGYAAKTSRPDIAFAYGYFV